MGIKTDLQAFIDPEYEGYSPPEINPDDPPTEKQKAIEDYTSEKWVDALNSGISALLAPCAAMGLLAPTIEIDLMGQITSPNMGGSAFPTILDTALKEVATGVVNVSSAISSPVAPTSPLDSLNEIFATSTSEKTPEQVCADAESRIITWFQTGTFSAFMIPGLFPGIPNTPWGLPVTGLESDPVKEVEGALEKAAPDAVIELGGEEGQQTADDIDGIFGGATTLLGGWVSSTKDGEEVVEEKISLPDQVGQGPSSIAQTYMQALQDGNFASGDGTEGVPYKLALPE